jgi:hypothetical protein
MSQDKRVTIFAIVANLITVTGLVFMYSMTTHPRWVWMIPALFLARNIYPIQETERRITCVFLGQ